MKRSLLIPLMAACFSLASFSFAQTGPFDPESWPATIKPAQTVHFVVTDAGLEAPSASWNSTALSILTGSDHVTADFTIGGHTAKKATANHFNIADSEYTEWADDGFIDILVQVYGDAALFNASGEQRNYNFLIGTLPDVTAPNGGQIPVEARNKRWNWFLFRIPNGTRADGTRFVGSVPANAQGDTSAGGVNGGTIRFESVSGITVRVVAFGPQGAFGEPEDINKFLPPVSCDPEPNTNLAGIDLGAGITNHLEILNGHDHTVTIVDDVGPANDKRKAVVPDGTFLNFGITDEYLGKPCNDSRAVKICVDFYDDPNFAGLNVAFGPEAYATDDLGGVGFHPETARQLLAGTGQWIRRSWVVPGVNLKGVNADQFTAGPRFISQNGQVAVSRFELAVLREGTHPLAGQDPLAGCFEDPNICTDAYANFVELDLAKDIRNGLDVGSSSGDQVMIIEPAGPANDIRLAVRPAQDDGPAGAAHKYLNFAITDQKLGPNSQPNAHLAICLTYYDDPALAGTALRPEVYITEHNGIETFGATPDSFWLTLAGSGVWKDAYWEISDMKFNGVNQTPQAAARFTTRNAGAVLAKIAVTSVRYGVIRPCGPLAGVNPVEGCKPVLLGIETAGAQVKVSWPATATGYQLQVSTTLDNPQWAPSGATVEVVNGRNVATVPIGQGAQFFRIAK